MHRLIHRCRAVLLVPLLLIVTPSHAQKAAGHWEGEIALPGTKLGVQVTLEETKGAWSGSINIPVQSVRGFKLGEVKVEDGNVRFKMPGIPGDPLFSGKLDETGAAISGDYTQAGQKFAFKLKRMEGGKEAAGATPSKGVAGSGLAGFWQGSLRPVPAVEMRIALEITKTATGALEGSMVSLDQGSQRIPLKATEKSGKVKVHVADIGGSFEGTLNADGSELAGDWLQSGQKLPLKFLRIERAAVLKRPQEPQKPYPYDVVEAVVENKAAGVKLFGSFTVPRGVGKHPAVVLISGSGPQDRDETVMGHRPFLVLADHLTRAGFAVLRYDDRGVGKSTGDFSKATHYDFVEDALAAVTWLQSRGEIDSKRIGLVGHSEGGIAAPLAVVKRPNDIAFMVLLAGVGMPLDELLVRQGMDLGRVMGQSEADITEIAAEQRELFKTLKTVTDADAARKLVRESAAKRLAKLTPEQKKALGMTESMVASQVEAAASPWFRQLIAYDPRPTLRQVKCPVLAINGELDKQVAAKENLAAIREALAEGNHQHTKIAELPGLNHLFQTCTTGAISEYGQIEETFAPAALKMVSDWLRERAGL